MPARTVEQRRENARRSKAKRKRLDDGCKAAVASMMQEAYQKVFPPRVPGLDLVEQECDDGQ